MHVAVLVLVVLILSPAICEVYRGEGNEYFTYAYKYNDDSYSGLKIIYRPEDGGQDFAPYGPDYKAYVRIIQFHSENEAEKNYIYELPHDGFLDYNLMQWNNEGRYYYIIYPNAYIWTNTWFAYGVKINKWDGDLIYQQTYTTYYTPSRRIKYCELDSNNDNDYDCSEAIASDSTTDEGSNLVVPLIATFSLLGGLIVLVLQIYIKRRNTTRNTSARYNRPLGAVIIPINPTPAETQPDNDLPPSYNTAVQGLCTGTTSQGASKEDEDLPPTYTSAVMETLTAPV